MWWSLHTDMVFLLNYFSLYYGGLVFYSKPGTGYSNSSWPDTVTLLKAEPGRIFANTRVSNIKYVFVFAYVKRHIWSSDHVNRATKLIDKRHIRYCELASKYVLGIHVSRNSTMDES